MIKKAGFEDVAVVEEKSFPMEYLVSEATMKEFIENLDIPLKKLREIGSSVVSVKVSATKKA